MSLLDQARIAIEDAKTRYREDLGKNAERLLDRAVRQDPSSLKAARALQATYEDVRFEAMDLKPLAQAVSHGRRARPAPADQAPPEPDVPVAAPPPPDPPASPAPKPDRVAGRGKPKGWFK